MLPGDSPFTPEDVQRLLGSLEQISGHLASIDLALQWRNQRTLAEERQALEVEKRFDEDERKLRKRLRKEKRSREVVESEGEQEMVLVEELEQGSPGKEQEEENPGKEPGEDEDEADGEQGEQGEQAGEE
jgi:hypothetical protein